MSWSSRRAILVLSMLGTLVGVSLIGTVSAQRLQLKQPIGGPGIDCQAPVVRRAGDRADTDRDIAARVDTDGFSIAVCADIYQGVV